MYNANTKEQYNMSEEAIFQDAKSAVKFADEMSLRAECTTLLGKMLLKPGTGMPIHDLKDIAMTVSHIVEQCNPHKGDAIRIVYGVFDQSRAAHVSETIGMRLKNMDAGKQKDRRKLNNLAYLTIKETRLWELHGERLPMTKIARQIPVNRKNFRNSLAWPELYSTSKEILLSWIDQADRTISLELDSRGWLA